MTAVIVLAPSGKSKYHKTMSEKQLKKKLRDYLSKEPDITLCILYGSAASEKMSSASDVDIAIGANALLSPERLADIQLNISELLHREADITDLRRAQGPFLQQILTKGEILKKNNGDLYAQLLKQMWYFNADMRDNYNFIISKQVERLINGS